MLGIHISMDFSFFWVFWVKFKMEIGQDLANELALLVEDIKELWLLAFVLDALNVKLEISEDFLDLSLQKFGLVVVQGYYYIRLKR